MEAAGNTILDADLEGPAKKRRELLPWWIKLFSWLFLVAGALVPIIITCALAGIGGLQVALYGIETFDPLSQKGLIVCVLFLLKGVTSVGLLFEKNWAVTLGKIDAGIGIAVCVFMMIIWPLMDDVDGFNLKIRLELLLLVPFMVKLVRIERDWVNRTPLP